jgi:hypothetical protein
LLRSPCEARRFCYACRPSEAGQAIACEASKEGDKKPPQSCMPALLRMAASKPEV